MSFFVVYKRQNLGSMRVCMFYFISFFLYNDNNNGGIVHYYKFFIQSFSYKIQTVRQWVACGGHCLTHIVSELLL